MARVKFGSVVVSGNGSLGGATIQNSNGGAQMRSKPIPRGTCSASQYITRISNKKLQDGWRSLTDVQRLVWIKYVVSHHKRIKKDDERIMSGHSYYMQQNYYQITQGLPLLVSPFDVISDPLGAEIIKNGSFDNHDFWSVASAWTISGGMAHYDTTLNRGMDQESSLTAGVNYRISFDIIVTGLFAKVGLRTSMNDLFFPDNFGFVNLYETGHVSVDAVCALSDTDITLYSWKSSDPFSIDNLSIREIL